MAFILEHWNTLYFIGFALCVLVLWINMEDKGLCNYSWMFILFTALAWPMLALFAIISIPIIVNESK